MSALFFLFCCAAGCHRAAVSLAPNAPLPISLWYWHQPFRVSPSETVRLRAAGISELFVRAGTIARDGETGAVRLILPQQWATPVRGIPVHLVFPFDRSVVSHLETLPSDALSQTVAVLIGRERERASAAGIRVIGVQLDLDCPTRLLPRYAELLRRLRADKQAVPPGTAFSITALPTWLTSEKIKTVAAQVDFLVPQFYEARTSHTLADFAPIGDEGRLRRGMEAAARLGAPFRAGLPAYGHALVYDGAGTLRGAFRDAGVTEMARRPEFRVVRAFPLGVDGKPAETEAAYSGEDIVELGPSAPQGRTDFRLVFDLPTPTLPARQIAIVRAHRPLNCGGVILYRYPDNDATQAVPLSALLPVVTRKTPSPPHLTVKIRSRVHAPWARIDVAENAAAVPEERDWLVSVTNDGESATTTAPDAVQVLVRLDRADGLRAIESGGFLSAEPRGAASGARVSLARADAVLFSALRIGPGETLTIGPIRVASSVSVVGETWRAALPGGFRHSGDFSSLSSSASPPPKVHQP